MHLPQNVVNNAEEKNKKRFDAWLVINKGNLFKLSTFIALFRSSLFHSPFHSNTLFPSLPQSQGVRCVTSVKIPLVPSTVLKTFVYRGQVKWLRLRQDYSLMIGFITASKLLSSAITRWERRPFYASTLASNIAHQARP